MRRSEMQNLELSRHILLKFSTISNRWIIDFSGLDFQYSLQQNQLAQISSDNIANSEVSLPKGLMSTNFSFRLYKCRNPLYSHIIRIKTEEPKYYLDEMNKTRAPESKNLKVFFAYKHSNSVLKTFSDSGVMVSFDYINSFNLYYGSGVAYQIFAQLNESQVIAQIPAAGNITQKHLTFKFMSNNSCVLQCFDYMSQRRKIWEYFKQSGNSLIYKPTFSSRGKNLKIINSRLQLGLLFLFERREAIVQEYIEKPYLINGYKFDFRVYAFISSVDPLIFYVYNRGMVRFCNERYGPKTGQFTNFEQNRDIINITDVIKSKADLSVVLDYIEGQEKLERNVLRKRINQIIRETFLSSLPLMIRAAKETQVLHRYPTRTFQLFGFDIILTQDVQLKLLEVNNFPSMETSTQFDKDLKYNLFAEMLDIVGIPGSFELGIDNEPLYSANELVEKARVQLLDERSRLKHWEQFSEI